MENPFPGMNPYLEQYWREIHQRLITYTGDALQSFLPESLRARIEERVFLETEDVQYRQIYPDVHVVEHRPADQPEAQVSKGDVAIDEPVVLQVENEPITQRYIEIVDAASGNRVVTVIEFISPSNKLPGEGRDIYLRKQREVIGGKVNLVEIDLTRTGQRVFALPPGYIPPKYRTTYQVCVRRASKPLKAEVYMAPLSDRLPVIGIPLRPTDSDVPLNLQALIEQCYKNGRYDDIDYKAALDPPLDESDAAWMDQRLNDKGVR
ncbi:MAG: DUF4058 family protein [Pirellulales bacterium]|nr:DUF4058 family protein [Pirellulales bacterium]